MSIAISGSFTVGLGVPARKGVAGLRIAVGGQAGCLIIGHGLIPHAAAVGGVAVESDAVVVGLPLGIQLDYFSICCGQIHNVLSIAISGSFTVGLGVPARKGVAGLGIAVGGQAGCLIIGHGLIPHAATVGGIAIESNAVVVGSPLGIQRNGFAIYDCKILS